MNEQHRKYYAAICPMISIAVIWGLIILFILQPGIAHDGAEAGAQLFVHALLPYLLPYIILTQWLLKIPVERAVKEQLETIYEGIRSRLIWRFSSRSRYCYRDG